MKLWKVKRYVVETILVKAINRKQAIDAASESPYNAEVIKITVKKIKGREIYLKMDEKGDQGETIH